MTDSQQSLDSIYSLTDIRHPVVVVKVKGLSPPPSLLRFEPLLLLLMKKCYFMHKMCQIPHRHRHLRPLSPPPGPLLDLATSTTADSVLNVLHF